MPIGPARAVPAPPSDSRRALLQGLADALGFVLGALAGWGLGRALGFDVMAPGPMTLHTAIGWLLLMAGLGAGKALANWLGRRLGVRP